MKKKQFAIDLILEILPCDCGGVFDRRVSDIRKGNPARADFVCNKCGKKADLPEMYFPVIRQKIGKELA